MAINSNLNLLELIIFFKTLSVISTTGTLAFSMQIKFLSKISVHLLEIVVRCRKLLPEFWFESNTDIFLKYNYFSKLTFQIIIVHKQIQNLKL